MSNLELKINNLLTNLGKSKKWLCGMLDVSEFGFKQTLSNNSMKVEMLEKISDLLGVPVSYFFENSLTNYETGKEASNNILQDDSIDYNQMETSALARMAQKITKQSAIITEVLTKRLQENKQDNV
jgi:hypothetical protein